MAKQRMGLSLAGCHNLNNWRHLFNPNSPSALQGEIACDLYWGRQAPEGNASIETTRSNLDERTAQPNGGTILFDVEGNRVALENNTNQNQQPDGNGKKILVAVVVIIILVVSFKNL